MLTEKTKQQLKPLVTETGRDPLQPRLVIVYAVDIPSGARAAKIIKAATGKSITNVSGIGPAPFFKKMFAVRFDTTADADEFEADMTETIAEAVDEGTFSQGTYGSSSFFNSTLFYALCGIVVVVVLAFVAFNLVQKKKI